MTKIDIPLLGIGNSSLKKGSGIKESRESWTDGKVGRGLAGK